MRRAHNHSILSALLLSQLVGCTASEQVDTIIRNVAVIDVATGSIAQDQSIVISDERIVAVIDSSMDGRYDAESSIDGGGYFAVPMFGDAHVHLQSAADLDRFTRWGVGLVVNLSGDPSHLELRRKVATHELLGPEILTAGPTLDGNDPTNPLFNRANPDNAAAQVRWMHEQGYDVVKVYQQIDAATLTEVTAAADSVGLTTTGHVSRETGILGALDSGLKYVAHGEELAFEAYDEPTRTYDGDAAAEIAALLAMRNVTLTPMLAYLQNIPPQVLDLDAYLSREAMNAVPASTRVSYDSIQGYFSSREEPRAFAAQIDSLADFVARLTVAAAEQNVKMILGTDAGFGGAVPGYSVHEEMRALVDAGLTELQVLQQATLNIGRYAQQLQPSRVPWGRLEPSYSANVLLLGSNPLDNILATQDIRGILIGKTWLAPTDLENIGASSVAAQAALLPSAQAFESALLNADLEAAKTAIASVPKEYRDEPLISASNCIFLGYRHYYGGKRALAGKLYELCAQMHPASSPLWIHIARAAEDAGNIAAARLAYEKAHALNPWYGSPAEALAALAEAETD